VYCGSKDGARPEYGKAAMELGHALVKNNLDLVYGGGNSGMMGLISTAVLEAGGNVIGVIPEPLLKRKSAVQELSEIRVVKNIHERKALMMDLADGFIAMPGGLGTFEEFFEVINWSQLKLHNKPYGLLNTCNFFGRLIDLLDHIASEGFFNPEHKDLIHIVENPYELILKMKRAASQ